MEPSKKLAVVHVIHPVQAIGGMMKKTITHKEADLTLEGAGLGVEVVPHGGNRKGVRMLIPFVNVSLIEIDIPAVVEVPPEVTAAAQVPAKVVDDTIRYAPTETGVKVTSAAAPGERAYNPLKAVAAADVLGADDDE